MKDRTNLLTEQRLPESMSLDLLSIRQAVALMNAQDRLAFQAVAAAQEAIARTIELVVAAFRAGGRLFYVGAGTSGRLGVLDAAECPPTFRSDPRMVQGIIAGGRKAMFRAQEGAEDSKRLGAADLAARKVGPRDVVIGIATGGTTPYVHGALREARRRRAATAFLTCIQPGPGEPKVDVTIRLLTGPEVLTGSTRLKAGTATKLVLNTITTVAMVQIGKVYENLMVDLRASNAKLRDRAIRIVCTVTGVSRQRARQVLSMAGGHVKLAILMIRRRLSVPAARRLLAQCAGNLRRALESPTPELRSAGPGSPARGQPKAPARSALRGRSARFPVPRSPSASGLCALPAPGDL